MIAEQVYLLLISTSLVVGSGELIRIFNMETVIGNYFLIIAAPQRFRDSVELKFLDSIIEIFPESKIIDSPLYDQLQKILRGKDIEFLELDNFTQLTDSGYESNTDEFKGKIKVSIDI